MHIHLCVQVPHKNADEDAENKVCTLVKLPLLLLLILISDLLKKSSSDRYLEFEPVIK